MDSQRQRKISRLIQKELSEVFQRELKNDVGNAMITVTNVRVTSDLSLARIYLSLLMVKDNEAFMEWVKSKTSEIRLKLGNRIAKQVRKIPALRFYLDDTAEYASHMDQLLSGIDIPPEDEDDDEDDKKEQ